MEIEMRNSKPYINGHEAIGVIYCEECQYSIEDKTDGNYICLSPKPTNIHGTPAGMQKVKAKHYCSYAE